MQAPARIATCTFANPPRASSSAYANAQCDHLHPIVFHGESLLGGGLCSVKDYQSRLQLFALAYNLPNSLRRLALPQSLRHWSLTILRERLIKIGAKVTRHAKYVTFQLAEVAVPRRLFAAILDSIVRLARPPPAAGHGV